MDKGNSVVTQEAGWEIFSDAAHFDMWCLRPAGEKRWGAGIHVVNRESAEWTRDYIIASTRKDKATIDELRGALDDAAKAFEAMAFALKSEQLYAAGERATKWALGCRTILARTGDV